MKFESLLEEGKYKVLYDEGNIEILRYGEPWRNETGDGFLHALLMSHIDLEMELFEMKKVFRGEGN
tara:strand:- start:129635 stop:129832 length:198 start_codon:yes stop_codon:yes gene_type:complete